MDLVCLCAEWCGVCRQFRAALEGLRGTGGRVFWIDIEATSALADGLEIEDFPVVAIVDRAGRLRFAGTIEPGAAVVERLMRAASRLPPLEPGSRWQPVIDALSNLTPLMEIPNADD